MEPQSCIHLSLDRVLVPKHAAFLILSNGQWINIYPFPLPINHPQKPTAKRWDKFHQPSVIICHPVRRTVWRYFLTEADYRAGGSFSSEKI